METLADLAGERSGLMALAYRMLGTIADAEDAVQETYVRWYRMPEGERAAIDNPAAWLTRVASRVCLDVLGSARVRREQYVGEWLPEPVPTASPMAAAAPPDPLDRVTLDDSVSTALLIVLEALTPAQRVVFVLHDVFGMPFDEVAETVGRTPAACRQLATAARRHVRDGRARRASRALHDQLVAAFADACATGDLDALTTVLAPDVELRSDGGGKVSAARRPVRGADDVGRFLLGLIRQRPEATMSPIQTADGLGFIVHDAGIVEAVITVGVADAAVTDVWIMRNPDKLTAWE